MQFSSLPTKFSIPWANAAGAGYIRTIPTASQIGITNGAASLTDGFVPINMLPVGSGGTPPFGQDMNGILKQITLWTQWQNAGGTVGYDSGFATSIGGYPQGAIVASTTAGAIWLNTVDNNTTNPDSGGTGWVAFQVGVSGASTQFAPKLHGIKANGSALGTVLPASTATKIQYTTTTDNKLSTSTWASNRLTIGAGEGGGWVISASMHLPGISSSYYCQIAIFKNGSQISSGTTTQATASTAQYCAVTFNIDLVAGDYIEIFGYQQSSGSITVQADTSTAFAATLIEAN